LKKNQQPHPFQMMLEAIGGVVECDFLEYDVGYVNTAKFKFRFTGDEVEIGVNKSFDRWANSRDFVCRPVPTKEEDFQALMAVLERAVTENWTSDVEFQALELWPFVRKQRRETRNAERISAMIERRGPAYA
jgi:hypothetical protein